MKLIWIGFLLQIIILAFLKPFFTDYEGISVLMTLIHITYTLIVLAGFKNKQKFIFIGGYFARVALMFWDLYARNIFVLPNSGLDSEMYYENAIRISTNMELLSSMQGLRGGVYSQINGILFYFIGPQRLIGQYINVLLGLSTLYMIYRLLLLVEISTKTYRTALLIAAFFPTSVIMSAIFLREAFPTFFLAASLYFFIKWFKKSRYRDMILSFIMIGVSSAFHSGLIGVVIGYVFAFLFYHKKLNKFKFRFKSIVSFFIVVAVILLGTTVFGELIFKKFGNIDEISDIYGVGESFARGGSAYLKGLTINNPIQLFIYSPIRSFYFIASPLPWNWRGFLDVFTFFTDSILYLGSIFYFIKHKNSFRDRRILISILIIMILGSTTIFGFGVSNAGTAIRHRQKLVPLFIFLWGLMLDAKRSYAARVQ